MPSIELLPATAANDDGLVAELTGLVNRVYAVAEEGLWVDGATRTTPEEMARLIAAEEIAVAQEDRSEGRIVGSVQVRRIDDATGEFGMLVSDPQRRGEGIGRELVRFAEERSRRHSVPIMQLELLVPRGWTHPTKEFLDGWYTRMGYRPMHTGRIDDDYPHLAPLLATPCNFVIYHKALDHQSAGRVRRSPVVPGAVDAAPPEGEGCEARRPSAPA
jgi:GNAT superfamily N-acetyltransferase